MSHRLYVKELIKRDTTAGTPGEEKQWVAYSSLVISHKRKPLSRFLLR